MLYPRARRDACIHCPVSLRRLFSVVTGAAAMLIVVLIALSILDIGGAVFEDRIHNLAEVGAGFFACAVAFTAASAAARTVSSGSVSADRKRESSAPPRDGFGSRACRMRR